MNTAQSLLLSLLFCIGSSYESGGETYTSDNCLKQAWSDGKGVYWGAEINKDGSIWKKANNFIVVFLMLVAVGCENTLGQLVTNGTSWLSRDKSTAHWCYVTPNARKAIIGSLKICHNSSTVLMYNTAAKSNQIMGSAGAVWLDFNGIYWECEIDPVGIVRKKAIACKDRAGNKVPHGRAWFTMNGTLVEWCDIQANGDTAEIGRASVCATMTEEDKKEKSEERKEERKKKKESSKENPSKEEKEKGKETSKEKQPKKEVTTTTSPPPPTFTGVITDLGFLVPKRQFKIFMPKNTDFWNYRGAASYADAWKECTLRGGRLGWLDSQEIHKLFQDAFEAAKGSLDASCYEAGCCNWSSGAWVGGKVLGAWSQVGFRPRKEAWVWVGGPEAKNGTDMSTDWNNFDAFRRDNLYSEDQGVYIGTHRHRFDPKSYMQFRASTMNHKKCFYLCEFNEIEL